MSAYPCVKFAIRYPAGDGTWRYVSVVQSTYVSTAFPPLQHVPAVGDLVSLYDQSNEEARGIFRVLERMWMYSSYGSADWPYGQREPSTGPLVDVIVEPADGPYRDEAPICGESTCEAQFVNGEWWMPPGAVEPDAHEHQPYEPAPQR